MAETSAFFSRRRDDASLRAASPATGVNRRRSGSCAAKRPLEKRRCMREVSPETCGICLDTVSERGVLLRRLDFGMLANSCAHTYCFTCVVTWAERTNTCPMCKERFNAVRRTPVQRLRGVRETVEVEDREPQAQIDSEDEDLAAELQEEEDRENGSNLNGSDRDEVPSAHGYVLDDFVVSDGDELIETDGEAEQEWEQCNRWTLTGPESHSQPQRPRFPRGTVATSTRSHGSQRTSPASSRRRGLLGAVARAIDDDSEEEVFVLSSGGFGSGRQTDRRRKMATAALKFGGGEGRASRRGAVASEDVVEVDDDVLPDELRQLQREAARLLGDSPLMPRRRPRQRTFPTPASVSAEPLSADVRSRSGGRVRVATGEITHGIRGDDETGLPSPGQSVSLQRTGSRTAAGARNDDALRWGPWIRRGGVVQEERRRVPPSEQPSTLESGRDREKGFPSRGKRAVAAARSQERSELSTVGSGCSGDFSVSSFSSSSSSSLSASVATAPRPLAQSESSDDGERLEHVATKISSRRSRTCSGVPGGQDGSARLRVSRQSEVVGGDNGGSSVALSDDSDEEVEWMAELSPVKLAVDSSGARRREARASFRRDIDRYGYKENRKPSGEERGNESLAGKDGPDDDDDDDEEEETEFDWHEEGTKELTKVVGTGTGRHMDEQGSDTEGTSSAGPPTPSPLPLRTRPLQRNNGALSSSSNFSAFHNGATAAGASLSRRARSGGGGRDNPRARGAEHQGKATRNGGNFASDLYDRDSTYDCTFNDENDENQVVSHVDRGFRLEGVGKTRECRHIGRGGGNGRRRPRREGASNGRGSSGAHDAKFTNPFASYSSSASSSPSSEMAVSGSATARLLERFRFTGSTA